MGQVETTFASIRRSLAPMLLCLFAAIWQARAQDSTIYTDTPTYFEFTAPDLTGALVTIGNPLPEHYRKPDAKGSMFDLQCWHDRIYIAHGSSNSGERTLALYLDVTTNRFEVDRDEDGDSMSFNAEQISRIRLFGEELFFANYDPLRSPSYQYRRRADGSWQVMKVSGDAHNRDLFFFEGKLFVFDGGSDKERIFPSILWSTNEGKTWSRIRQPELFSGKPPVGVEFFSFKNYLYATFPTGPGASPDSGEPAPFMLRHASTAPLAAPFEVAFTSPPDFIADAPNPQIGRSVRKAMEFKGKLCFIYDRLRVARSLDPARPEIEPALIEGAEQFVTVDLIARDEVIYALSRVGFGRVVAKTYQYVVLQSDDGIHFRPLFSFHVEGDYFQACETFEESRGNFYFAFHKGNFLCVPATAYRNTR